MKDAILTSHRKKGQEDVLRTKRLLIKARGTVSEGKKSLEICHVRDLGLHTRKKNQFVRGKGELEEKKLKK